ncbi:MAG TPA: helix-turn-helix domain-containing protein [Acetobacteraceae bacterium]|nr:helix-turn-helix domain-containing protein [Acetobacteraceae bacterium]
MIRTATDVDEFAAAIRTVGTVVTVTRRGDFVARLTRIDLHSVWMQRGEESLPRILQADHNPRRYGIAFASEPAPAFLWNGVVVQHTDIAIVAGSRTYSHRSSGPQRWGSMSLSIDTMQEIGAAVAGRDPAALHQALILTPPASAMARLRRLHAAAAHLAETTPELIADADAVRGLDQLLIHAFVSCLNEGQSRHERLAQGHHGIIIRRFRRQLEENPDRAIYLPELCAAIGVAERTLRACCQEHLGMSPKRYLLLRRLHLAHRALRDSTAAGSTVTEIATRYGFWELGRFAGAYRSLFGEPPSATLRRAPA